MARFEDTPGLFGIGVGGATYGNITCEWCGTDYAGRQDKRSEGFSDEAIGNTHFGDLQVCDCCFEKVEAAVLSRMGDIIPWFIRILKARRTELKSKERMLVALRKALAETETA